jgi:hypothetical protein
MFTGIQYAEVLPMPNRIRTLDRHYVRLNDTMMEHVDRLARMAGVSPSDVLQFVLSEVFEAGLPANSDDSGPVTEESPEPVLPRRRVRRPADVIPITRKAARDRPQPRVLRFVDPAYLRRQAADLCRHAQNTRACAVEACDRATDARARAHNLVEVYLAAR